MDALPLSRAQTRPGIEPTSRHIPLTENQAHDPQCSATAHPLGAQPGPAPPCRWHQKGAFGKLSGFTLGESLFV